MPPCLRTSPPLGGPLEVHQTSWRIPFPRHACIFLVLGFRGTWLSHAPPRVPKQPGLRMQPYPRAPDLVWPGHRHGTGRLSAQAMDTGFPTVVWRFCLGPGGAWARVLVTPPTLAGVLGGTLEVHRTSWRIPFARHACMFLVLGFRGAWVSHAPPRVPKQPGLRMQPYPRAPDLVWPGHLHGTGRLSAQAMDTGFPTVVWRFCLGPGCAWARVSVTPPTLAGVFGWCVWVQVVVSPLRFRLGFVVYAVGFGFCLVPHHSWLRFWRVRGCVCALPVPRRSRLGCAVWVCVLGLRFRLRPATPA